MTAFEDRMMIYLCDPAWDGISTRDVVMFVTSGITDPDRVRDYIAKGITYEQAFRMEYGADPLAE